ncbi:MAG: riboflavin synthase, partial [Frankiaceae bacterium]|jgi:riboflavin synthase|nr:riboflavin synthase [Frankiaceae bacterium]
MFTGIVAELGRVVAVTPADGAARLTIAAGLLAECELGDSVAVDGVCLTVASLDGDVATMDVMGETLRRTAIGSLGAGDQVNLELAVTPQTRLGGHLVQGHVDGVGTLVRRDPTPQWDVVTVTLPDGLAKYVVEKGSICLHGVSLTVVAIDGDEVTVSLIPETLRRTTWGTAEIGSAVNVEVDVLAKYVERLLGEKV